MTEIASKQNKFKWPKGNQFGTVSANKKDRVGIGDLLSHVSIMAVGVVIRQLYTESMLAKRCLQVRLLSSKHKSLSANIC